MEVFSKLPTLWENPTLPIGLTALLNSDVRYRSIDPASMR